MTAASGFVPYGVGSVVGTTTSSSLLMSANTAVQQNNSNNNFPYQFPPSDHHHQGAVGGFFGGADVVGSSGGGGGCDPTLTTSYQNPSEIHDHQDQYQHNHHHQTAQTHCSSYEDINMLVGAVDSGLSLCTQAMTGPGTVTVTVPDPVAAVGPVSPLMWPLMNDVESTPSIWDYGDPLGFDFRGFD